MRHNRSSIASRRNRRRARAKLRDLAIYGTANLQECQEIRDATRASMAETEKLLVRGAWRLARATGENQWVVRDRLAGHAPRIVPACARKGGTYGVGVDGSTPTPTRHGHERTISYGRAYGRRVRGHGRVVDGVMVYDCRCGCKLSARERDLQSGMSDLLPETPSDS